MTRGDIRAINVLSVAVLTGVALGYTAREGKWAVVGFLALAFGAWFYSLFREWSASAPIRSQENESH